MKKYKRYLCCTAAAMLTLAACKGGDAVVIENDTPNFSVSAESESDVESTEVSVNFSEASENFSETETSAKSADASEPEESDGTPDTVFINSGNSASDAEEPHVVMNGGGIVLMAQSLIGTPFTDGGDNPDAGFDNSGFIYYVLRSNGYINCPRQSSEQTEIGQKIKAVARLSPGDLVFFGNGGKADFGGIYIGDGQMIYSPMPGQTVKQIDMSSDYWRDAFIFGIDLRN